MKKRPSKQKMILKQSSLHAARIFAALRKEKMMDNRIRKILTDALKDHYSSKSCDEVMVHLHVMKTIPISDERTLIEDLLEYMRSNPSKVEEIS